MPEFLLALFLFALIYGGLVREGREQMRRKRQRLLLFKVIPAILRMQVAMGRYNRAITAARAATTIYAGEAVYINNAGEAAPVSKREILNALTENTRGIGLNVEVIK